MHIVRVLQEWFASQALMLRLFLTFFVLKSGIAASDERYLHGKVCLRTTLKYV